MLPQYIFSLNYATLQFHKEIRGGLTPHTTMIHLLLSFLLVMTVHDGRNCDMAMHFYITVTYCEFSTESLWVYEH
jgi:hypothetical protein